MLCLVDDAQWLDRTSALVLGFVARRLLGESVAMLFAVREPIDEPPSGGPAGAAHRGPGRRGRKLAPRERRRRAASTIGSRDRSSPRRGGNPLALLELTRGTTAAELAGGFVLPGPGRPAPSRSRTSTGDASAALPDATQRLLLLAAADPTGDATLLWRAAQALDTRRTLPPRRRPSSC